MKENDLQLLFWLVFPFMFDLSFSGLSIYGIK